MLFDGRRGVAAFNARRRCWKVRGLFIEEPRSNVRQYLGCSIRAAVWREMLGGRFSVSFAPICIENTSLNNTWFYLKYALCLHECYEGDEVFVHTHTTELNSKFAYMCRVSNILFLCTMWQLIHFLLVYSEFTYVFGLYSVEIYGISQNSLWYMCVRLREKTDCWNISHTHTSIGTHYLLICIVSNILFYALCDNYEFKYVLKLYSVDICALFHTSLWYMCVKVRLRVQMYIILYSHLCNVSRFLTIVYKEWTIHDVCCIVKYTIYGIVNFISSMYIRNLCNSHDFLCLFTRNTWRMCSPHCVIYKLVTVTHNNLWVNNFTNNWNVLICATLTYVIHNFLQLINMMYIT